MENADDDIVKDSSSMKSSNESIKEVRARMRGILTTKNATRLGTWNVRTAWDTGKLARIINEMNRYQLWILGLSEMRWTGSGKMFSEDITVLYSGGDHHERGVGVLLNREAANALDGWEHVSDRIMTVRILTRFTTVAIVQMYAPTNSAYDGDNDELYEQLQAVTDDLPSYDLKIVMDDFNAQI
jgi:hypothetical protein